MIFVYFVPVKVPVKRKNENCDESTKRMYLGIRNCRNGSRSRVSLRRQISERLEKFLSSNFLGR